jgi:hypothetical protein
MRKIKIVIKVLMIALFGLSINIAQASELNSENINDTLSKKNLDQAIDKIIALLKEEYIFPEKALRVEAELRHKLTHKKFDEVNGWYSFIQNINLIIRNVSDDMYLDIVESHPTITLGKTKATNVFSTKSRYGIDDVKILSGNVGYMKLNQFYQNVEAEKEVFNTLEKLSTTDALIIDLRGAEGDSISLVHYFISFFVEEKAILSEVLYDKQNKRKTLRSLENSSSDKFKHNFPLYILTSSFLSNSGEFFSYTLKHLKKAIIVGEETMGVAYVLRKHKINNNISLHMPIAIHLNPNTKTNWAEIGVIPDVYTNSSLSLDKAHKMAKQYLGIF